MKNAGNSQSTNVLFSNLIHKENVNEENMKTNGDTNNNTNKSLSFNSISIIDLVSRVMTK